MKIKLFIISGILVAGLTAIGCGTTGKEFDTALFENINNGNTTQEEVESMFGLPFKKGFQNGNEIWVYEHNKYKAFKILGEDTSKDMVVIFDENKVVKTHVMMNNQSDPE
ncbi:hypothetical protein MNBD_NITROSPINAE05-1469 [hydrothermal vent metagenome]|uniref:Uncharacterized protein n=1 Tax=hydrothermal vent metagenome TaxID=652676 RepID=A0A3B1D7T9_9ZZZZ